nr:MAG TPA: hypothetical protein [Bacteriophage sp.]DAH37799.1 MAG TPA: hypothetical protein [Caudoviricetes sp.]
MALLVLFYYTNLLALKVNRICVVKVHYIANYRMQSFYCWRVFIVSNKRRIVNK